MLPFPFFWFWAELLVLVFQILEIFPLLRLTVSITLVWLSFVILFGIISFGSWLSWSWVLRYLPVVGLWIDTFSSFAVWFSAIHDFALVYDGFLDIAMLSQKLSFDILLFILLWCFSVFQESCLTASGFEMFFHDFWERLTASTIFSVVWVHYSFMLSYPITWLFFLTFCWFSAFSIFIC